MNAVNSSHCVLSPRPPPPPASPPLSPPQLWGVGVSSEESSMIHLAESGSGAGDLKNRCAGEQI